MGYRHFLAGAALLVASASARAAVIRGREVATGPDGRLVITQVDPFGLDTEETAQPAKGSDGDIIRQALDLLPTLGCIGQSASSHLGNSVPEIRFGPVSVVGRNGETARGQVAPHERGSEHLTIIIDASRPYLRDPRNAARVIAHELVHDLQYHAGILRFDGGKVASDEDLHDPEVAERVLGGACRISDDVKAKVLLLDGDAYVVNRKWDAALKAYSRSLQFAHSPDLTALAHLRLAQWHHYTEGGAATEFWPHIDQALAGAAALGLKVEVLLEAGGHEARYGSKQRALRFLDRAEGLCASRCAWRSTIEEFKLNWSPDGVPTPRAVQKLQDRGAGAVLPP